MAFSSMPERYEKIINTLTSLAKTKDRVGRCRVVSSIFKRNKIFSIGFNSYNGGTLSYRFKKDVFAVYEHAEISAIKNFLKEYPTREISEYGIIVVRVKLEKGKWVLGCSKPCLGCQKAIHYFQMKKIVFLQKKRWLSCQLKRLKK